MWRFLSLCAGSDVSLGVADRIAASLDITKLDLEEALLRDRWPVPGRRWVVWVVGERGQV